jgi:hypothetical protein
VALGVLTWHLIDLAITSVQYLEVHWSYWAPPVYPLRVMMAFGSLMLFLQSVAVLSAEYYPKALGHRTAPAEVESK